MRRRRRSHDRGMALILALTLLGLLASVVVILTSLAAIDLRRTAQAQAQEQVCQLLSAGQSLIHAELDRAVVAPAAKPTWSDIPLPADLSGQRTTLRYRIDQADEMSVRATVIAQSPIASASQTLSYAKREGHWQLRQVSLDPVTMRR